MSLAQSRRGSYVCGTPQNDGDRDSEEEGHTETGRPGLRPHLHSHTDEPHALTQALESLPSESAVQCVQYHRLETRRTGSRRAFGSLSE
jgi:hypothetical protein